MAADCPLNNKSWFYHTTSHYLCHKLCYHTYLVEISLGLPRNLRVYSRRFTPTSAVYVDYSSLHNLIVKCLIVQKSSLPFREQIPANRVFTTPPYAQGIPFSIGFPLLMKMHKLSEITVLYLLWCNLNYILTYVSRKTSYSSQYCLSLTYHSSLDIFTTITHSAFYKPDHGKITTLRVSN